MDSGPPRATRQPAGAQGRATWQDGQHPSSWRDDAACSKLLSHRQKLGWAPCIVPPRGADAHPDLCNRTLGEFELRERIEEDSSGVMYRAEQPLLGRDVVVKVLHQRRDTDALHRFGREAQLASRLDHPYVAHVYAFGVEGEGNLWWIARELVQGISLVHWLQTHGPMPLDQFVPFFDCIAEAVQAAHARGIEHLDLRPSNVMVIDGAGRLIPKLLDFGSTVSPAATLGLAGQVHLLLGTSRGFSSASCVLLVCLHLAQR